MRKFISLALVFGLVGQTLAVSVAQGKEKSPKEVPSAESIDSNFQPSASDLGYSERSATAQKFTFKDGPRELLGDLKYSFWGWGGLAFGLGAGLTAAVHPLDDNVANAWDTNVIFGSTGNKVISWTLSPYTIAGGSIITWAVGHGIHNPKVAMTGRALTEALFLSLGFDTIGKLAFRRERPDGGSLSFPSAHATASFTAAGVLTTFYGWKAGVPSYALATLVSVSRLDSHSHWLSDVVMGSVLGSVIGVGTARFFRNENPKYFLSPTVTRDEASIGFTYIH